MTISCSALLYTTNCNPKRHQSVQIYKSFGLQPVTTCIAVHFFSSTLLFKCKKAFKGNLHCCTLLFKCKKGNLHCRTLLFKCKEDNLHCSTLFSPTSSDKTHVFSVFLLLRELSFWLFANMTGNYILVINVTEQNIYSKENTVQLTFNLHEHSPAEIEDLSHSTWQSSEKNRNC